MTITDIKLSFKDPYFDLGIVKNDLETDTTLETAILISLFTDRRVTAEELPPEEKDRRGWWGDVLESDNDKIGSKLWLLRRQKITPEILVKAKNYCEEALQWLIDDAVVKNVTVSVERLGLYQISIEIDVQRPQDSDMSRSFAFIWGDANVI